MCGVLPRHARPRNLPTAVTVRGEVPLGRPLGPRHQTDDCGREKCDEGSGAVRDAAMTTILSSITGEFRRYKALGDAALAQLRDDEFARTDGRACNSAAILVWHIGGNLRSRFTDFLTSDGEKPWRVRDEEFVPRTVTRLELMEKWNGGWNALF